MAMVATVHPATNPLGAAIGSPLSTTTMRRLRRAFKDVGSGSVTVPRNSSEAAALLPGRYVRLTLDGSVQQVFRILGRSQRTIAQGEHAQQMRTVTGPGLPATLADARVFPPNVHGFRGDTRYYNFAAPDYPHESDPLWVPSVVIFDFGDPAGYGQNVPRDWPDWLAKWIWGQAAVAGPPPMPVGDCYFRNTFTLAAAADVAFYITADDGYELWVDGELLGEQTQAYVWRDTYRETRYCEAGVHQVAIKATNITRPLAASNYGGVLFSAITLSAGGVNDTVVLRSDASWIAQAYPAEPPGWKLGAVIGSMMTEAQARGACSAWSWAFTDDLSTSGAAFTSTISPAVRIGSTVLEVLQQLGGWAADWAVDHGTVELLLEAFGAMGAASGVTLSEGTHLTDLQHEEESVLATDLLARLADGSFLVAAGTGGTPVVELYAELGVASDLSDADAQSLALLDETDGSVSRATAALAPVAGAVPWVDFDIADMLTAPDIDGAGASSLVAAVTVTDRNPSDDGVVGGSVEYVLELVQ